MKKRDYRKPVEWTKADHPKYGGRSLWRPILGVHDRRRVVREGGMVKAGTAEQFDRLGISTTETRGPQGRRMCCWCGVEVPKGRLTWCSQKCVTAYQLENDWGLIRQHVEGRDAGVCLFCGCDTEKMRRVAGFANLSGRVRWSPAQYAWRRGPGQDWLASLGFTASRSLWDADHIHARADGGRDHPDNLRTLCVPCHKVRTARQAADRAAARRDAKASLFCGGGA